MGDETQHPADARDVRPTAVRARVLAEYQGLRDLYDSIEQLADLVLTGANVDEAKLRQRCEALRETVPREIEAQQTELAPVLRDIDAFGEVRAQQLCESHDAQRRALTTALGDVHQRSARELASRVKALLPTLRAHMAEEERSALDPEVLKDDPIDIAGPTS